MSDTMIGAVALLSVLAYYTIGCFFLADIDARTNRELERWYDTLPALYQMLLYLLWPVWAIVFYSSWRKR